MECEFCLNHEQGDTLYESSDWDGGKDEPQTDYTPDCPFCKRYGTEDCLGSDCRHYKTYKTEPQICDTCRYYNSNIPCGSTPSACKEADKFAEEFVNGLKDLRIIEADRKTENSSDSPNNCEDEPTWEQAKEYCNKRCLDIVDSALRKKWYKDEPQTDYTPDCPFCKRYGTEDCLGSDCRHYKTYKTEPQTERSSK